MRNFVKMPTELANVPLLQAAKYGSSYSAFEELRVEVRSHRKYSKLMTFQTNSTSLHAHMKRVWYICLRRL